MLTAYRLLTQPVFYFYTTRLLSRCYSYIFVRDIIWELPTFTSPLIEHIMNTTLPEPDISVIVPVYNVEAYIEECIRSIISQAFHNYELLLVDDCCQDSSIDKALTLLSASPGVNYRILRHEKNAGLSAARNTGLTAAKGRFIMFVDSDDWIPANTLRHLYETIARETRTIVCGNTIALEEGVLKPYWFTVTEQKHYSSDEAIRRMVIYDGILDTAWAKIYPKELFLQHNIRFPEGKYFEDTPTNLRLFHQAQQVIATPHEVYYYRRNRPGSILEQRGLKSATDRLDAFDDIYEYLISETALNRDFILNYYLELLVNEFRGVFCKYKLSIREQHALTRRIDKTLRHLRKQHGRKNFIPEIGMKFNWLLNNPAYRSRILLHGLHNSGYSLIRPLINTYLKKGK